MTVDQCKADSRWHPGWEVFMVRVDYYYVGFHDDAAPVVADGRTAEEACQKALAAVGRDPGAAWEESPF